ncbi:MAG TPA: alpha/beta hydrolase [Planctomycetaceae bacterium]|nr:alpha/beta hydrolase [Planctomycetaceae bacterium]
MLRPGRKIAILVCALCWMATNGWAADELQPLWPDGAPGKVGDEAADKPGLWIYPAAKDHNSGTAVVVCPGGGYGVHAVDHEGTQVARWLNSIGVNAYVLKYRLAPRYKHPAPMQDVQRAIQYVRANAEKNGISPKRVGVMGFSAGGHLASTCATHFLDAKGETADPIEKVSSRPDFAVLCYPVITMTESFGHGGSKKNLLGENPDPELAKLMSNELQVTPQTPPTFLFHTGEDTAVPVENALAFYAACRKHKVPAEMHVYQFGPHGVGLAPGDPALSTWKDRLHDWLRGSGFLAEVKRAAVKGKIVIDGEPLKWGQVRFRPASPFQPIAFAMVRNGAFSLDAAHGPVMGQSAVEVVHMGDVAPGPTVTDSVDLNTRGITVNVMEGVNQFDFDLKK